jgi:beta-lactamase regulating signal transducer with metallopeptidase domain
MHEHIARTLYYFGIHLLYASIVWLAAWVLTAIPLGSATTKYWIWVVTAINFVLPLGAVIDKIGSAHLAWAAPLEIIGGVAGSISRGRTAVVLGALWLGGATVMFTRLCLRLWSEHGEATVRSGSLDWQRDWLELAAGVPVRFAAGHAPAVEGVLHPHILLPDGIDRLLNERELNAVIIHELTHARRRDNLLRLIYEAGLCVLWFHPLVWIAGGRLGLYRELSCDESVIQSARGEDLVSALAKLADPEGIFLLQATASSFLGERLALLVAAPPRRIGRASSALLALAFAAVLLACVFATVAHTACCFLARI